MMHGSVKKLIIMDVDGVLFRGQFFLHVAWNLGIWVYTRSVLVSLLFNMDKISIHDLLSRVYSCFKDIEIDQIRTIYKKIEVIKNAKEAIKTLRSHEYLVVLVSSGVPDIIVKDLTVSLSADMGFGIMVGARDGRLTGEVSGPLSMEHGKMDVVEEILRKYNLRWKDTVVVVDDRNNLEIMEKAGVTVGVNAHYTVRKKANYLIDSGNLLDILDIVDIEDAGTYPILFAGMRKQFSHSWYQELRRKFMHIIIVLASVFSNGLYIPTIVVLFFLVFLYTISECLRVNGYSFPVLGRLTRLGLRRTEERYFAFGPITLVLGAVLSLLVFPRPIANAVIWIVAFADTVATLVGWSMGNRRIPYNKKKSIEGAFAAWVTAFMCAYIFLPLFPSFLAATFSTMIESLPLKSLDNFLIPVGTGIILVCFGYF